MQEPPQDPREDAAHDRPGEPAQTWRRPPVIYAVEVDDGALQLRIEVGSKSIPIAITPDQASVLGQALLAASALYADGREPGPGPIVRSDLPVLSWRTGVIREHGLAVLLVDILGGAQLALQFQPAVAVACARALAETGEVLKAATA